MKGKVDDEEKHTYRSMIHLELLDNFSKTGDEFFDPRLLLYFCKNLKKYRRQKKTFILEMQGDTFDRC